MSSVINNGSGQPAKLAAMRAAWSRWLVQIAVADIYRTISPNQSRHLQTKLAEASIAAALDAATSEIGERNKIELSPPTVLALGKLGSGTLDYDSDLDVIVSYDETSAPPEIQPRLSELYSRVVEQFITLLSDMTRDGNLYRVDLRLRPYGKNGPNVVSKTALVEYIYEKASVWELLAYVQMRFVAGKEADGIETAARDAIARRTSRETPEFLRTESRAMRLRLEETHGRRHGERETDIKFGSGGLLDIYFVVRYLQLIAVEELPDSIRSTSAKLEAFYSAGILSTEDFDSLHAGHAFLSAVDHNIRLIIGRSTKFPRANHEALRRIAERMGLGSPNDLAEQLALNRINIRDAFDRVMIG